MIYEYLQGDASRWKPYLDVLPAAFKTPMFWSPTELAELQASALVAKVGKEEADQMIKSKIVSVVRAHEHVFFPPGSRSLDDDQLLGLAHRMGSNIMAYAFDLEKDDENDGAGDDDDEWVEDKEGKTMLGMVPMADMLNADAEFNAHINHGEDALTATALRAIQAGEEILNYYGPLPNGELLRRYGYVTPKHSRYDVVELPWELVEAELQGHFGDRVATSDWEKVKQLVHSDEEFEESFVLERSSEEPDSTGQLGSDAVFTGLPDELGDQFKTFLKAIKKVANAELAIQALEDKDMRKELYLQVVFGALQARERQYATSLEEDEQLMNAGQLTWWQRMALLVRRGEKQILREAQAWVRREMDQVQNDNSSKRMHGDDGPAAKRRRV
jgi:SET domain-containing protein 6